MFVFVRVCVCVCVCVRVCSWLDVVRLLVSFVFLPDQHFRRGGFSNSRTLSVCVCVSE